MTQPIYPQQPQPAPPPARPVKAKRFGFLALGLAALISFTIGGLIASGGDDAGTLAAPSPTVTATATATATKTVTDQVAEVPQACLDALDEADRGFGIAADMMDVVAAAFEAVAALDVDEMDRQADKLNRLTEKLGPVSDRYNDTKTECRAEAGE